MNSNFKFLKRPDLFALIIILGLSLLIGLIWVIGDKSIAHVTYFSWQNKQVGAQDRSFTLTFNRQMNEESVATNLQVAPIMKGETRLTLEGKISWLGRKMTYTLSEPPIYGQQYGIQIQGAIAQNSNLNQASKEVLETFQGQFTTRDRAFAYIGVEGAEKGQLILYNLTQRKPFVLTPKDLSILDFAIYPEGDKILFSALDRKDGNNKLANVQLYTVTTGLNFNSTATPQPVGRIRRILDAKNYQNLKFDLSIDGQTIIVKRVNRNNPRESSLWMISAEGEPINKAFQAEDFKITPDGQSVIISQKDSIVIEPLTPEANSKELYPGYSKILGFAPDRITKIMIKYNPDYTYSLMLVKNPNEQQEIFRVASPIIDCKFEPRKHNIVYCLNTDLVEEAGRYREEPYLTAIDISTGKAEPLLALPNYRDVQMSMSPDGIAMLFDQVLISPSNSADDLINLKGETIAAGRLWLLPLLSLEGDDTTKRIPPEELISGFKPQWLP